MGVRRVVTGQRGSGSTVVDDGVCEEITFGPFTTSPLWATPSAPTLPYDQPVDCDGWWFPGPGAVRAFRAVIAPEATLGEPDPDEANRIEARFPGTVAHFEPDHPGMHTTRSVDVGVVVSGQVWLELDDEEVLLRAGDHVVQAGTRHAWHNRSSEPCVMVFFMVGADGAT